MLMRNIYANNLRQP